MRELTPLVGAQHGAFFIGEVPKVRHGGDPEELELRLLRRRPQGAPPRRERFELGEGLVGQAALERKRILIDRHRPTT